MWDCERDLFCIYWKTELLEPLYDLWAFFLQALIFSCQRIWILESVLLYFVINETCLKLE